MKTLLLATVAAATIGLAVPANAQFYVGADPGGVGVQVGPLGAGVGPRLLGPSSAIDGMIRTPRTITPATAARYASAS